MLPKILTRGHVMYLPGSKLYSMAAEKDKNMAVNIRVADFNKGNAAYFRAHPSVILCLQRVFSKVYEDTKKKVRSFVLKLKLIRYQFYDLRYSVK
jgi:hypothetical protein